MYNCIDIGLCTQLTQLSGKLAGGGKLTGGTNPYWDDVKEESELDEAKKATWTQPSDIKETYRHASILKNRRVVFNIKANKYRLIIAVAYRFGAVYIKFIGTHAQYDAINAETIELE